jgi:hypothetical protein
MAKNKAADNTFQTNLDYLTKVIRVRWTALPSIGKEAWPLIIQVKLSALCTRPTEGQPRLCGEESVIFIPVNKEGRPEGDGEAFLNSIGVVVPSMPMEENDLTPEHASWIVCQYGDRESLYNYQNLIKFAVVRDADALELTRRAFEARPSMRGVPGLKLKDGKKAIRSRMTAEFTSPIQWEIFKLLSDRYPDECEAEVLLNKPWEKQGLRLDKGNSKILADHISRIRAIIATLRLDIPRAREGRYKIVVRK